MLSNRKTITNILIFIIDMAFPEEYTYYKLAET